MLNGFFMSRVIIIGYGNIDRGDDGAACAIINLLRGKWGIAPLENFDTGMDALGREADSVFISQLLPEIMETLTDYDKVVFVDAHVGDDPTEIRCDRVAPEYAHTIFTHHMTPAVLLAFLKTLYNREPEAYLVSVRGYDFDFKQGLSSRTQSLLPAAVDRILQTLSGETASQ